MLSLHPTGLLGWSLARNRYCFPKAQRTWFSPQTLLAARSGIRPPLPSSCFFATQPTLFATMMVQALLLLPRLVVTPPARLVVVPSHRAAVRRFTASGAQLGEDGGKPAHDAEQLLDTISTAQARGGSVQMCSETRELEREVVLAAVQRDGSALEYASAELKADRETNTSLRTWALAQACVMQPSREPSRDDGDLAQSAVQQVPGDARPAARPRRRLVERWR